MRQKLDKGRKYKTSRARNSYDEKGMLNKVRSEEN